jgi:hypothetical protein
MGPGQLYQDLQNLLHDLNVVGQISQLIGNLRGSYQVTGPPGWDGTGRCCGFQTCEHGFVSEFSRMEHSDGLL